MSILTNQVANLIIQTIANLPGNPRKYDVRLVVVNQGGYPLATFEAVLSDLIQNNEVILLEADHLLPRLKLNPTSV